MCGGGKSAAPAVIKAPKADMSTSKDSQAQANAAAQRAMAGTIVSQTEPTEAGSFGAELGSTVPGR